MKQRLKVEAQALSSSVFHEVAMRPGYEPVDEDTAIALVSSYGRTFEPLLQTRERIKEIVLVVEKSERVDKDWLLEVLKAPIVLGTIAPETTDSSA